MVTTYLISVLGSNVMDRSLNELQDTKEFKIQTKLTDFYIEKLKKVVEQQK